MKTIRLILAFLLLTIPSASQILAEQTEAAPATAQMLHKAARAGDLDEVRRLLDAGVEVDAANEYDTTALSFAADKGHVEVLKLLIERGADVAVKDSFYGSGVVTWAAYNGHAEATAFLVEQGAGAGEALQTAIFRGFPAVAEAVLATEKVDQATLDGMLSMAQVALDDDEEPPAGIEQVIELLKKAGAKPPPPIDFQISAEALARYAGTYNMTSQEGVEMVLSEKDGVLQVLFPGAATPMALDAVDETTFRQQGGNAFEFRFSIEDGKVAKFDFHQQGRDDPFVFTPAPKAAESEEQVAEADDAEAAETPKALDVPKGTVEANWPAFRGPNADGAAQGDPPIEFSAESGEGVLWNVEIPGRAHASPIVWGDRLYLATAVSSKPEEPFRNGLYGDVDPVPVKESYTWRLYALDKRNGDILWQRDVHQGVPRAAHHIKATQANSTPVTDGENVVAVMGSEGLYCYDKNGNLLWKNDLGKLAVGWFYDPSYEWGHSSSPILYDGKVILQVDRAEDPFIAAYSLKDGSELWRTPRENLPSWGTPTLIDGPKGPEVVTNGSKLIRAYDPGDGKELWRLGPHSEVTVGTPVVGHGLVYVTGGYRPVQPVYAIRPGGRGDLTLAEDAEKSEQIAWKTDRGGTYMPTPLLYGDVLYTLANNGVLTAYDAAGGERLWRSRVAGRGGTAFTASPVAAAGRLYIASEDGDVYVVKHAREFELLAKNPLGEIIMASPAISEDVLYVRTLDSLFAVGASSSEDGASMESP